jgi:hypothetical protein
LRDSPKVKARSPPLSHKPLIRKRKNTVTLHTRVGPITLESVYGQDPQTRQRLCPLVERLGLESNVSATPELKEALDYIATLSLSYEAAAKIANRLGRAVNDSMIHRYVQETGESIERLRQAEVDKALDPGTRAQSVGQAARECDGQDFSIVIQLDGWFMRERGEQWGTKPSGQKADRIAWHEIKTGIVFRVQDQAATQSGRGMILKKYYEVWRGDPGEFGRRLFALALRHGLYQAKHVFVVADGGIWIWKIVDERFPIAQQLLDFFHASHHLSAVANALYHDPAQAQQWLTPLLHQLKHGGEHGVIKTLEQLTEVIQELNEEEAKTVTNGVAYFQKHQNRLGYAKAAERGCPIGSGAIESTCSQLQDRFKRTGQFWTLPGARHLMTLEIARRNEEWDRYFSLLWSQ